MSETATEQNEQKKTLAQAVRTAISRLQEARLRSDTSAARAALAQLRGAVDEEPGQNPQVWERVMEAIPENYLGRGDAPSDGEMAVHAALTLYAVHQQGKHTPMHIPTVSFGSACGRLMRGRTTSTKNRYDAALTASTFAARRYHLRGLIGLMNSDEIGFDYGGFAQDLFLLQRPENNASVVRRWGRDFFRAFTWAPNDDSESDADTSTITTDTTLTAQQ